jgi:Flp pilus assembly protein TadG
MERRGGRQNEGGAMRGCRATGWPRIARRCRSLKADARGATLLEFVALSLPFIALIVAVVEISLTFLAQQTLETVSEGAVRQIMTGRAQKLNMSQSAFKTMVCTDIPALLKCSNLYIDVQTVSSFASANLATPTITFDSKGTPTNSWNYNLGAAGDIVVLRVIYFWPVVSGPLGFDLANTANGRRLLMSTAVFKSEPY